LKQSVKDYNRIVLKIGSSLLYSQNTKLDYALIKQITACVSALVKQGREVVVVSSGAIATGMSILGLQSRPKSLAYLQAAAAIGQHELMDIYRRSFKDNGLNCAQLLLTWEDFDDRKRYLNAKNTIQTLLKLGSIPIINENDTVSTDEIKFGDNDRLSALVSSLICADILIILSDIDGLLDKNKNVIKTFSTDSKDNKLDISQGMNQFNWNLLYPEAEKADGMILWNGTPAGITAPPGNYYARVKVGNDSAEVPFSVLPDPNYPITQQEYDAQFIFLQQVQGKFNEVQKGVKDIRAVRTQINDFTAKQGKDCPKEVKQMADSINKQLTAIEEKLHQTKAKSGQDVLNYPIRLNDKIGGVFDMANSGNMAPSKQAKDVYADLAAQADIELAKLKTILNQDVPKFNQLIREKSLPVISVKKD